MDKHHIFRNVGRCVSLNFLLKEVPMTSEVVNLSVFPRYEGI